MILYCKFVNDTSYLSNKIVKNKNGITNSIINTSAVVIKGTNKIHFADGVLSWHNINGEDAEEILPAILITNRHPAKFKEFFNESQSEKVKDNLKMILIPLKKFCTTTTDVVILIEKLFKDIKEQKDLNDFKIAKEIKKGFGKALADSLILEPNVSGIGINLKTIINYFRDK